MTKKQKKEDTNMVMLCIYVGLAATLTMLGIYFLTKYII